MKSKNKIMDSFEEFIALPLSILKNRIIQITGYKSDFIETKSIDIELDDNTIRINCVNSENAYNLLSSVIYKREQRKKALLKQEQEEQKENSALLALVQK
jgi:protein subunit release factor B